MRFHIMICRIGGILLLMPLVMKSLFLNMWFTSVDSGKGQTFFRKSPWPEFFYLLFSAMLFSCFLFPLFCKNDRYTQIYYIFGNCDYPKKSAVICFLRLFNIIFITFFNFSVKGKQKLKFLWPEASSSKSKDNIISICELFLFFYKSVTHHWQLNTDFLMFLRKCIEFL